MRLDRKTYSEMVRIHGKLIERHFLYGLTPAEARNVRRIRNALDVLYLAQNDNYYLYTHFGCDRSTAQECASSWLKRATIKNARHCMRFARKTLPASHFAERDMFDSMHLPRRRANMEVMGWSPA